MEQSDLLRYVAHTLETLGVRYFVTGSTATIFYGEPRFTNDIDVVADITEANIAGFCERFPAAEFYVSESAARDAVRLKRQFNVIHPSSGLKVDLIVPEASLFNRSRFDRVRRIRAGEDFDVNFTSPEDAIIKKLESYRDGGSEKHLRDIAGVLKTSTDQIDTAYISRWAETMGVEDLWLEVRRRI